jgi:hypothetical protein
MVNDAAVDFFGNTVIVTTIPRLEMKNLYPAPRRYNRSQRTVRVAKNDNSTGLLFFEKIVNARENLSDLFAKTI